MTTAERTILQAEHGVQMQAGLAVVALCDVAEQAQNLALLVHLDRLVFLGGEIKPADLCLRECSDRGHRGARDLLPIGKLLNGSEGFFSLIEDQDKVRSTPSLMDFDFI